MPKPLTADELMWCDWFKSLDANEQQHYVSHVPFVEGAKRERARIRQELESFAKEVGWDEAAFRPYLDRICPEDDAVKDSGPSTAPRP